MTFWISLLVSRHLSLQAGNETSIEILIAETEWESLAHHKVYMAPDTMKEVLTILTPLIDTSRPVNVCHIPTSPNTEMVLSAPIVEVLSFANVSNISLLEGKVRALLGEASTLEAHQGLAYGWKVEEEGGQKFIAFQGWQGLAGNSETILIESIKKEMRSAQPLIGEVEVHHVTFKKYVA